MAGPWVASAECCHSVGTRPSIGTLLAHGITRHAYPCPTDAKSPFQSPVLHTNRMKGHLQPLHASLWSVQALLTCHSAIRAGACRTIRNYDSGAGSTLMWGMDSKKDGEWRRNCAMMVPRTTNHMRLSFALLEPTTGFVLSLADAVAMRVAGACIISAFAWLPNQLPCISALFPAFSLN